MAVREALGDDAIYPTDIGRHTPGLLPPSNMGEVDADRILDIGRMFEGIIGRRLRSECVHTERIPKALMSLGRFREYGKWQVPPSSGR